MNSQTPQGNLPEAGEWAWSRYRDGRSLVSIADPSGNTHVAILDRDDQMLSLRSENLGLGGRGEPYEIVCRPDAVIRYVQAPGRPVDTDALCSTLAEIQAPPETGISQEALGITALFVTSALGLAALAKILPLLNRSDSEPK